MSEAGNEGGVSTIDKSKLIRLRHGSKDSVDVDIVWVSFEPLPARVDCLAFCNASKAENGNLIYVDREQGVVLEVLKGVCGRLMPQTISESNQNLTKLGFLSRHAGSPDETNNSIRRTFPLHSQVVSECPIKRDVIRNPLLKVTRCLRSVLSRLTRLNSFREKVKSALNSSDLAEYINVLAQIDFSKIFETPAQKPEDSSASAKARKPKTFDPSDIIDVEQAKAFTFQIAQTWALLCGIEVYTKSETAQLYPELEPALYRRSYPQDAMTALEPFKKRLISLFHGDSAYLMARSVRLPSREKVKSLHGVSFTFARSRRTFEEGQDPSMAKLCDYCVIQSFAGVERALHFIGRPTESAANWAVFECEGYEVWLRLNSEEWKYHDGATKEVFVLREQFGNRAPHVSLVVSQETMDSTSGVGQFHLVSACNTVTGELLN